MLDTPTQITSHLLAALNLPPLENASPYPLRNRPLPLEPAASSPQRDAYTSVRRPVQQQQQNNQQHHQQQQQHQQHHQQLHHQQHHQLQNDQTDDHHQISTGDTQSSPVPLAYPPIITPPKAAEPPLQHGYHPSLQTQLQQAGASQPPQQSSPLQQSSPVTRRSQRQQEQQQQEQQQQQHEYQQQQQQDQQQDQQQGQQKKKQGKRRRMRRKWTEQETNDLIIGCREHGVGNWKKVLDDPKYKFDDRSAVDLKDRFRTCFPKEYRKDAMLAEQQVKLEATQEGMEALVEVGHMHTMLGPAPTQQPERGRRKVTKTELHHAEVLKGLGISDRFPKVARRERREFTAEEDHRLLQGFQIYGPSWSRIQGDPALHLAHRRSTDLRDRFRNAFPDRYESAGFKARPRQVKSESVTAEEESYGEEDVDEDHYSDKQLSMVDPAMAMAMQEPPPQPTKADSTAFIVNNLMNEHLAANWIEPLTPSEQVGCIETPVSDGIPGSADQSPVSGILPLDPALDTGFGPVTLEQLTSDILGTTRRPRGSQAPVNTNGDGLNWDDMSSHSMFADVESAFAMDSKPMANMNGSCNEVKSPVTINTTITTKPASKPNAASAPRKRRPSGSVLKKPTEKKSRVNTKA
ncbi:hypothetical protein BZA05DRAFT_146469 [Tricharina praecox]|uniref:uncharacterized protein n=1 Tax=Tricharina praecox TaxID=43433 RepID=UPI0022209D52|nr:uncharacterized protein BZA05DRAFT_146469 [Tricharina praecox]KAI5845516.1 hypothetical protein BZA05DRAFT_146469 [Tricharina praecox]